MRLRIGLLFGIAFCWLCGVLPFARACTGFVAADGESVLAGNNEDYNIPNTRMWVMPPEPGKYGRIYFGFDNLFPQGGVNEKGLFYDGFALAPDPVQRDVKKLPPLVNLTDKVMAECAAVEDVIKIFERYNRPFLNRAQLMFGDASGDSVIIEGKAIVRKKGRFQVVTNFRQSKPGTGLQSCDRFRIATQMLQSASRFDKSLCRRILAAVHNEGEYPTLYSNVYDLKNGKIYLYHYHNFENEVVIDVAAELKKGKRLVDLPAMFPETFTARNYMKQKNAELDKQIAARRLKNPDVSSYPELAGDYLPAGLPLAAMTIHITCQGPRLFGELSQIPPVELLPESPNAFFYLAHGMEVKVTFNRDPEGKVLGLTANQNGQNILALRKR